MSTRLLERPPTTPTPPEFDQARPAARTVQAPWRHRSWYLPAFAVVVTLVLIAAGNTSYMLFGIALLAAGVLLSNSAPTPTVDPIALSLTAFLTVVIAVPFGKLPHNRTTSIVFMIVLLTISLSGLARSTLLPPRGRLPAVLIFLLLVPASLYGPDAGAIKRLAITAAAALPAFFLGGQLDRARLRTLSLVLLALAMTQSVLAILEPFAFPDHLWVSSPTTVDGAVKVLRNPLYSSYERSQGTLGHPLAMGIVLVIAIALLVRVLHDMTRWMRFGSGAVILAGLFFSGDRSCILAMLLIVIAGRRLTSIRVFISLGVALAITLTAVVVNAISGSVITTFASSGSFVHRASAYRLIWHLFSTQPASAAFGGNGFGSTQRLFDKGLLQTDGFNVVDNQFVLTQAQGGVLCLAALVVLAVMAIRFARPELRIVVFFAVGISAIFDWMSWPSASALIFTLLGASLATLQPSRAANRSLLESPTTRVLNARQASPQG